MAQTDQDSPERHSNARQRIPGLSPVREKVHSISMAATVNSKIQILMDNSTQRHYETYSFITSSFKILLIVNRQ